MQFFFILPLSEPGTSFLEMANYQIGAKQLQLLGGQFFTQRHIAGN